MNEDIQILLDVTGAAYRLAGRQMDVATRSGGGATEAALREAFKRLGEAHQAVTRALEASRKDTIGLGLGPLGR